MRKTILVLVMVLAACGSQTDAADDETRSDPDQPEQLGVLAYDYEPGQTIEYQVELTQNLTASGTSSLTSAADDEADVTTEASGRVRYDISDGPEEGLVEVAISGEFDSVETTGTFNGNPIDTPKDITTFAPEVEEPKTKIVVDRQGRPWRGEDGPSGLNPLWLLNPRFAAFDPLEDPLGPLFTGDEVAVGDSWTITDSTFVTDQEVTRSYQFTVDAVTGPADGRIVTISYTSETTGFAVDFGDTVRDLLSFLGRGSDDDAGLSIVAAPASGAGIITFDVADGTVLSQQSTSRYSFNVDASIPLEEFAEADIVLNGEIEFTADRIDTSSS